MNLLIKLFQSSDCAALCCLSEVKCWLRKIIKVKFVFLMLLGSFYGHMAASQKYEQEIDSISKVLEVLPEEDTNRVNALINMARLQTFKPTGETLKYAKWALELSERLDYQSGIIESCFVLGYYFDNSGRYVNALEYLYKALDISIKIQDGGLEANCHNFLGYIHKSSGQYPEALTHYNKSLTYWEQQKNPNMEALILENIGGIYFTKGDNKQALEYYNQAFNLAKANNLDRRLGTLYNSLGEFYYQDKDFDKALEYQQSALEYAIKIESTRLQSEVYGSLSEVYLVNDQSQEAFAMAEKALYLARLSNSKHEMLESYQRLYTSLQQLGDYQHAYEYQSKYLALHDSLSNLENVQAIEHLKYKHEIELVNEQHKANVLRRNALIGVLVALLIIGMLIFNRRYLIIKKKLDSKRQLLNYSIRSLEEKSKLVENVNRELQIFKQNATHDVKIKKFNKVLQFNIVTDDDWENFKKAFEDVYPNFLASLRYHYPNLTTAEIRQAALIKMKLTIKETASILGITPESVKKSRHRLKKKLELSENKSVDEVLNNLNASISND
ncbi:tetratricopeptide repeat protein [Fulvivirga sp. 29W222]|uniref:Tetratricopeptide repeat protein n=1 Tax=Fulvivirga marina TaxID=2494733 RepID=A0A937KBC0_9BACT|nr:tetratricopeptide repeat protein [Fulvivirga marina]MBL6446686.1 tetratricopeptide repeat protein [Fulvivirga marina]